MIEKSMSIFTHLFLVLALLSLFTAKANSTTDLSKRSIPDLQHKIDAIDRELETLAHATLGGGSGNFGYRSMWRQKPNHPEWVQIELGREWLVDKILIAPILWRHTSGESRSDAFPESFRLIAGNAEHPNGTVIANFKAQPHDLPRIAPLIISIKKTSASWIRMEVDQPSIRAYDNRYVFQLSEIMVFSGGENVALRCPVSASSLHPQNAKRSWSPGGLTDGHTPFYMNAASGQKSIIYLSSPNEPQTLEIDLQASFPISRIHLHTSSQPAAAPRPRFAKLGMPQNLLIEGANRADFSDATVLLEYQQTKTSDSGPIMKWPIPETLCRYVRISDSDSSSTASIGFDEIELYANGKNVALGKTVTTTPPNLFKDSHNRRPIAMTDGRNSSGNILSTLDWLQQLARRHDLERERPLLVAELYRHYAQLRKLLRIMSWITAALAIGIAFTLLITRMLRMQSETRLRERFAADLHDELGANLHTIGLLGDLARTAESHDELIELLDRSRFYTERSGTAVRDCTNTLENQSLCQDLAEDMKRSAERLLSDLEHDLSFEGEAGLKKLKPRKRVDLFLFYKECLNNIIRHSGATRVSTQLQVAKNRITLRITDNGIGLGEKVPPSLKRRAKIMGAQVTTSEPSAGGSCITLQLSIRRLALTK